MEDTAAASVSSDFQFHSDAVPDGTFGVAGLEAREQLSRPYQVEILLLTKSKPESIKLEDLITSKVHLAVKHSIPLKDGAKGTKTTKIHGILSSFELVDRMDEQTRYRAVLVPRFWKLSLTQRSHVFQDMELADILKEVLTDKKSHNFVAGDFSIKLSGKYPKREFVVQYNESDFDFLNRWMEYEGVFYFFEQTEEGDKIVFADAASGYPRPVGTVPYLPPGAGHGLGEAKDGWVRETVSEFRCRFHKTPTKVTLKDYNYRTPSVPVSAEAAVEASKGEGTIYEYGEHFKTASEGEAIAKIRAEAIKCREKVFEGKSDVKTFRPGLTFTLADHFHPEFNAEYVITHVAHRVQVDPGPAGSTGSAATYQNEFGCIRSNLVFRPERVTEWPAIFGFMNATIDAGGSGEYAEVDDGGRYKVKLPFDLSDKKDGKASRFVRMAQPYAGAGMGMHFPLHKGTEVLLSFIDGDPDRPIIASAVPNPETSGPVSGKNATQCKIATGGGTAITIEDTSGSQQLKIETPTQGSFFTMGAANSPEGFNFGSAAHMNRELGGNEMLKASGDQIADIIGNINHTSGGSHKTMVGGSKKTIVAASQTTVVGASDKTQVGASAQLKCGASRKVMAGAAIDHKAGGKHAIQAGGVVQSKSGGATKIQAGAAFKAKAGAAMQLQAGAAVKVKAGAAMNLKSGAATNVQSGAAMSLKASAAFKAKAGGAMNLKAGGTLNAQGAAVKIKGPTDINGATKIKGAVNIKGETKIKGATQITGATKINGNTLQIS